MKFLPHKVILNDYIQYILKEDLTYNDITTELVIEGNPKAEAIINYRDHGMVCGLPFLAELYKLLDPSLELEFYKKEGDLINPNTDVAKIRGAARSILSGERTALNLLQKASGVATLTNKYVEAIKESSCKVTDTRKNTPGARLLEKYSIKIGGANPHRYNLSDSVLIKDNHIEMAGSITEAVRRVKQHLSHTSKIEVETENEAQVKEALESGVDIIMLDNMSPELIKKMVDLINNKAITEASGNVNLTNIAEIAKTGVNYISTSSITVKAPVLDIGMDFRLSYI